MFKHPIQDLSLGLTVGVVALGTLAMPGCGAVALPPQAETARKVAECKLEAVKVLPPDLKQVTAADIEDVVERLKACREMIATEAP